jgi:hypothetical protein
VKGNNKEMEEGGYLCNVGLRDWLDADEKVYFLTMFTLALG